MITHTPGPWHTAGITDPDGPSPMCSVWGPTPEGMQSGEWICRNVNLKNGPLIAAAPALAEAVQMLLYAFRECVGHAAWADFEASNRIVINSRDVLTRAGL